MRRVVAFLVSFAMTCAAGADVTVSAPSADAPSKAVKRGAEASIPFADRGGIFDWRVVNDKTVLIESQDRVWYKATLLAPCIDLPFAERIGFESNPDGSFDKFSAIQIKDQRCSLVSLVKTTAPAKDSKKRSPAAAPPAAPPATPLQ